MDTMDTMNTMNTMSWLWKHYEYYDYYDHYGKNQDLLMLVCHTTIVSLVSQICLSPIVYDTTIIYRILS